MSNNEAIKFGVLSPKTDLRDYKIKAAVPAEITSFELEHLPDIKNQGSVGSCVAHALSCVLEWLNESETDEFRELSTGFIYGMQGVEFNRLDEGMYMRDACKIVQKYGDCLNETVSFNIEMPHCYERLKTRLNDELYKEAAICRIESYAKCDDDDAVKYALMNYGPVLMSVKWYLDNDLDEDNVIHFDTTSSYGGHAVMAYGFNEKGWLCQNSWGKYWGDKGRFILPYDHGYKEAWSFVDAENSDVHKPKRDNVLDILYKMLNSLINMFRKFKKD